MLQQAAKTLSLDKILYFDGFSFGVVRHWRQVNPEFVQRVDAVIIETAHDRELREILLEIRNLPQPEDYLKPVFIAASFDRMEKIAKETDGTVDLDDLGHAASKTRQIYKKFELLADAAPSTLHPDQEILLKTLQFLFTRDTPLTPYPDRHAKLQYNFPFAGYFFDGPDEHRVLHVLQLGEKQGWLSGKVVDKIHQCPACGSGHINLRATCPKCNSVDILEEDLVHHFPCAHIAPVSDFKTEGGDGLHCPKCDKSLRHIGNDYDKPSSINNCNACHHTFQQADYRALCIDCGEDTDLHRLEEAPVRQYQLTSKGQAAVKKGIATAPAPEAAGPSVLPEAGICTFDVFKILIREEVARQKSSPGPFPGMAGQIRFFSPALEKLSKPARETFTNEVCRVIKSYLDAPDIVSARAADNFYFLKSSAGNGQQLKAVLAFNLQKLLETNLGRGPVDVKVEMEPLVK